MRWFVIGVNLSAALHLSTGSTCIGDDGIGIASSRRPPIGVRSTGNDLFRRW
jgi:hypothetical protein